MLLKMNKVIVHARVAHLISGAVLSFLAMTVVLSAGISVGLSSVAMAAPVNTPPASVKPAPMAARPVMPATAKPAQPAVRVLIKAAREARIASQMSGRITELPMKMGQSFRRGDLLVGFDCAHQQAEQAAAVATFTKADKTLASKKSLAAMKAVSDMDVQLADADLAQARAQIDRAKASVRDCRIVAPYDGSVVRVAANHAEFVGPGSPLIEIVERGTLHVEALVQSTWLTWLKPGQRFTITVDELGRDVVAEVMAIGARVDPVSQTIAITGKIIQTAPGLRAGMSGNAKFAR